MVQIHGKSQTRVLSVLVALALIVASGAAFGQATQSGNIYGTVADEQGVPLPGVNVTLTGGGAPRTTVTGGNGEYRFLQLSPGSYSLSHNLQGFATVNRGNVAVNVNKNTELAISMKLSGVQESIVVTSEVPLLDTRKANTGATISKLELESIPSARDPWVVMQTVPGVQVDRMNIGGNESGQQSNISNKGADNLQTVWNIDGVNITDMGSLSSPAYYDFDSFEEINVSTGGSDPSAGTPGVQLNLVTKRGTNDLHGSARVLITDRRWQADNTTDELRTQLDTPRLNPSGNRSAINTIQGIQDYGADVGGPIIKDRLWLWGSYGRNQIDLNTIGGSTDKTTLEGINAKMNAQIVSSNSATVFFSRDDKIKLGRSVGPTRPAETGWNQAGPTQIYKLEDSHVFSPNFFATALVSYIDTGFGLISAGRGQSFEDDNSVWHNSYYDLGTSRPQTQVAANSSFFTRTGEIGHEFKVGFSYRKTPVTSTTAWPAGLYGCSEGGCGYTDADDNPIRVAVVTRDGITKSKQFYYSGYLSDTLTLKNLTINLGVRYDYQKGNNAAVSVIPSRASALAPGNIFSAPLDIPAVDQGVEWKDFQPRVGLTYSLGSDQKTLLRASYAKFVDQLGGASVTYNGIAPGLAGAYYAWNDANHNNRVDAGEVDTSEVLNAYGVDPENPNSVDASPNVIQSGFGPKKTHEVLFGVEREIVPTLAVSVMGTYRRINDININNDGTQYTYATGFTSANYQVATFTNGNQGAYGGATSACSTPGHLCGTLPNGTAYDVPVYQMIPGTVRPAGRTLANNDGHQRYLGAEFQLNKRYANKWMARASFTFNDWKSELPASAIVNPTINRGGINDPETIVAPRSTGSGNKGGVFLNSKWQMNVNALYSLPLGFNVSGAFFARQGYPIAYYKVRALSGQPAGDQGNGANVALTEVDAFRYPTVSNLDLRLEKVMTLGTMNFTLGIDVFNVLNRATVLQRQNRVGLATTNTILEIQSARVARFGGRVTF